MNNTSSILRIASRLFSTPSRKSRQSGHFLEGRVVAIDDNSSDREYPVITVRIAGQDYAIHANDPEFRRPLEAVEPKPGDRLTMVRYETDSEPPGKRYRFLLVRDSEAPPLPADGSSGPDADRS